jgi:hypothetical protein
MEKEDKMRNHCKTGFIVPLIALLVLITVSPAVLAQADDPEDPKKTSVSGAVNEDGVELSFEVTEENKTAVADSEGGAWYDDPVLIAVIGVGALIVLLVAVLTLRAGHSSRASVVGNDRVARRDFNSHA